MSCSRVKRVRPESAFFWASVMRRAEAQIDYGEPLPELTPEFLSVWSRHYAAIAEMAVPRTPVLEVGTGYGILAAGLGALTHETVWTTEHPSRNYLFSPSYRHFLKTSGVHTVANDLVQGLPFADCCMNQIYLCDVIEHLFIPDAACLLNEMIRVLSVGGELIVSTPNANRLSNLFRFFKGHSIHPPQQSLVCGKTHGHIHEYAPKEIYSLLECYGLKIMDVRYGLNPLYVTGAFGPETHLTPVAARKINRITALVSRYWPEWGDQIYILARKS